MAKKVVYELHPPRLTYEGLQCPEATKLLDDSNRDLQKRYDELVGETGSVD